jgi:hypothetical protein
LCGLVGQGDGVSVGRRANRTPRFAAPRRWISSFGLVVGALALAKFAVELISAPDYGNFCDELYAIALSKHLALGYVDVPPLAPALLALDRALLGESYLAIHLLPALAGALQLVFVCLIARRMGGRTFAVAVAGLGFLGAQYYLMFDGFFSYDAFDQLFLTAFLYVLIRFLQSGDRRLWLVMGAIAGICCLNKVTILFLGPGFLVALVVSKYRRDLMTPWPYLGAALCLLIVSPYLVWEALNGWPTLEYWNGYSANSLYPISAQQFFINVVLMMNLFALPLLALGLVRIFGRFGDTNLRFFGVWFVVSALVLFWFKARIFMLLVLLLPVIAAGALALEELIPRMLRWRWAQSSARVAAVAYLTLAFIVVVPASLPVLPLDMERQYAKYFSFLYKPAQIDANPVTWELPGELANRLGWEQIAATTAEVYNNLDPAERSKCGIFAADWYGPAGAIDLLGPKHGLPASTSGFLTYWLWGPGDWSWDCMIVVGGNPVVQRYFIEVELAAVVLNPDGMPYNTKIPIYVCRHLVIPRDEVWPHLKNWFG